MFSRCMWFVLVLILASTNSFSQSDNFTASLDARIKQVTDMISLTNQQQAEILYLQSKIKQKLAEHNEALRLAEEAVKADSTKAAYHLQVASVLSDEVADAAFFKRIATAKRIREQLKVAMKLEPRNPDCLFGMMMYYELAPGFVGGDKKKAHHVADQIGRIDRSKGYLAKAQLASMERRTRDLEGLYLNAVKADATSLDAWASLASFYSSEARKNKDASARYTCLLDPGHN